MTTPAKSHRNKTSVFQLASFDQLCHGNVPQGPVYHQAIVDHARELTLLHTAANQNLSSESIAVLYVPRGGLPTGEGVVSGLRGQCKSAFLTASNIKTQPAQLYPAGVFDQASTLVIADGIIGTGKTIVDHLQQIPSDWKGKVEVVSNAASALGLKTIWTYATTMPQPVTCVTGRILMDDECEWVDFPNNKKVYFVGYNKARNLDYKLPDFGDHIQP